MYEVKKQDHEIALYIGRAEYQQSKVHSASRMECLETELRKKEGGNTFEIPQWQKDIVLKRLEAYENGCEDYLEFEYAVKEIEKDL